MSFAEAKAVAEKNPGAVLTRDSAGDHIVKTKDGELLYSPTLSSHSDETGGLSQPKVKEPTVKVKKRLLDPFLTALAVGMNDLQSKSVDPLLEQAIQTTSSRPIEELFGRSRSGTGRHQCCEGKVL